jgi:signal transduction histidine kinase
MGNLWWFLVGLAFGVILMLPLFRALLGKVQLRARVAERRARNSERLAELGSMTSGLAHEIKNPLSTIGLNAQLLAEGIRDAELADDHRERLLRRLDSLSREVDRLSGILSDFLQFAGRMNLDAEPRDLVQLVEEVSDFFMPQCVQSNVTLRTQTPDGAVVVRIDERLFKQALLNLMINAVQAMTSVGDSDSHRELMVRIDADDEEVRVHVIDTGPGVQEQKREEIFHPYVSTKSGGTGLGLPTARRIVEEHGGRITLHAEIGQGSDFVIHLPRG